MEKLESFKNYKKIHKLTKPRSPIIIEFITNDFPDEWLITVIKYKKSGVITDEYLILGSEIESKIKNFQKEGYVLTNT